MCWIECTDPCPARCGATSETVWSLAGSVLVMVVVMYGLSKALEYVDASRDATRAIRQSGVTNPLCKPRQLFKGLGIKDQNEQPVEWRVKTTGGAEMTIRNTPINNYFKTIEEGPVKTWLLGYVNLWWPNLSHYCVYIPGKMCDLAIGLNGRRDKLGLTLYHVGMHDKMYRDDLNNLLLLSKRPPDWKSRLLATVLRAATNDRSLLLGKVLKRRRITKKEGEDINAAVRIIQELKIKRHTFHDPRLSLWDAIKWSHFPCQYFANRFFADPRGTMKRIKNGKPY